MLAEMLYTSFQRQSNEISGELSKRKTYVVGNYESVVSLGLAIASLETLWHGE